MQISLMDLLAAVNAKGQVQPHSASGGAANAPPSDAFAVMFNELRASLVNQTGLSSVNVSEGNSPETADVTLQEDGDASAAVEALLAALNAAVLKASNETKSDTSGLDATALKTALEDLKLPADTALQAALKAATTDGKTPPSADNLRELASQLARVRLSLQGKAAQPDGEITAREAQQIQALLKNLSDTQEAGTMSGDQKVSLDAAPSVPRESFRTARLAATWSPPVPADTTKGETKVPVTGEASKQPVAIKVNVDTEKVSPTPAPRPDTPVPPEAASEADATPQTKKDFPSDLRVARLVREINPDLARQLNAAINQEALQASVRSDSGTDPSTLPVMKASEVTTGGTDSVSREPVQTQVVAKVPLTEVGRTVVRQVRMTGLQQDRTVTVKLIPESLGEVQLEIRTQGNETTIRMASSNATVRETLESQMHLLREALGREGLDIQRVQVTSTLAANNGTHTGQHQTHSQQQPQWGDGRQPGSSQQQRGHESFQEGHKTPEQPRREPRNDGSLNLFV